MSGETVGGWTGWAVTGAALSLVGVGTALLFAGQEVGGAVFGRPPVEPLASLLGGALVGFGAMNWIARRSTLGGIYGKAVVVGNQAHFIVGAIVLLKHGIIAGGPLGFWILTGFYVVGAGLFSFLLLGPGARR
jgi:hypothetical protein